MLKYKKADYMKSYIEDWAQIKNKQDELKDAIKSVGGKISDGDKEKAVEAMLKNVELRSAQRAADGGKLGVDDALRAGDEALRDIEKLKAKRAEGRPLEKTQEDKIEREGELLDELRRMEEEGDGGDGGGHDAEGGVLANGH